MRTPVFELHIRPMFRSIDREHMQNLFGDQFDLWDYDFLKENIERVLGSLERGMPPDDKGGPWPPEWILLLHRWKATGFKRLQLGKGAYKVSRFREVIELIATFTPPEAGWTGWLQLESSTGTSRTYVLYFEPPDEPQGGPGEEVTVSEQFSGVRRIFVIDRDGSTELQVPEAPT